MNPNTEFCVNAPFSLDYQYLHPGIINWNPFNATVASSSTSQTTCSPLTPVEHIEDCSPDEGSSTTRPKAIRHYPNTLSQHQPTPQVHHNGALNEKFVSLPMDSKRRRCKRKTLNPANALGRQKQFITEDRIAEHMSKLHINTETARPDPMCSGGPSVSGESDQHEDEPEQSRVRRLYVCEQMRKLQAETILPQALLRSIPRPCTALVLWTPPPSFPFGGGASAAADNNNDRKDNGQVEGAGLRMLMGGGAFALMNNNNNNNNDDVIEDQNVMDMDMR